jgi:RNA polymerase sigma factor (sigma-70 family)
MTELELIKATQAGDRKAADQLLHMHRGFIILIAKKYTIPGLDFDDVLQLARIGFFEGVLKFDPSKGVKLISFAVHYIRKQLHIVLAAQNLKKRNAITLSLDTSLPDSEMSLIDTIEAPIEEPTEQDFMPGLVKCISTIKDKKKRAIFEAMAEQLSYGEIATLAEIGEMFNLSGERVRQIKEKVTGERAFQKLREDLRAYDAKNSGNVSDKADFI